ncbi:MAG: hypothetical protein JW748_15020 [Anaerolineales bacterium]|nr:hypothetical protein [Anaerolineales bacterium]
MGKITLLAGGTGSLLIALLHVAIPIIGVDAYLYFGGYWLLPLIEQGSPLPAMLALSIAAVFFLWTAYAFSGASLCRRLPLLRTGLILISAIYIVRGADFVFDIIHRIHGAQFELKFTIFSATALILGFLYLVGTILLWKEWGIHTHPPEKIVHNHS